MNKHHENMGLSQDEVDDATEEQITAMCKEIEALHKGIDGVLSDLVTITPHFHSITLQKAIAKLEKLSQRL